MKRILSLWLVATLLCGLGATTSCEKGPTPEEQQKQKKEQASRYWRVVSHLVSVEDITDDYQDKTFEPTIGTPDAGDPLARIVSTNSLQSAVMRYNSLTGAEITTETATHTFSDPDVGTLTWTKSADGRSWATVDVDIKQLPKLKTIVYQSPEQGNDNGKFDGKSYYRFGDVLRRESLGVFEYWICVRPCFGLEGKEKSHWVCVNILPDDYVFEYESKNWEGHFYLPDDIGVNEEHMQNFAELLWALCFPDEWERNVGLYSKEGFFGPYGLPFFGDFHVSNLDLHNKYFWQNVRNAWKKEGILQKALNYTGTFEDLGAVLRKDGVNLIFDDYSWWTWWDDKLTLFQASFTNGSTNEELNLHHADYRGLEKDVNGIAKIDCRKMGSNLDDYNKFFADGKLRWVIRHATGAELSDTGDHGPQQPLSGVYKEYRYYSDVAFVEDLNKEGPEVTKEGSSVPSHYRLGDVYKDQYGNRWMVVFPSGILLDESPYTELVSFDGISLSADKRTATNLSGRNATVRTGFWLFQLFFRVAEKVYKKIDPGTDFSLWIRKSVMEATGVDFHKLFQHIRMPEIRNGSVVSSFAYKDKDAPAGVQPLIRYVMNNENEGNFLNSMMWQHYPQKPDKTTEIMTAFSDKPIYLQDLASKETIETYAPDFYVCRPISLMTGGDDVTPRVPFSWQEAQEKNYPEMVKDVSNFFYDKEKWSRNENLTDMWRAPILFFRATAIRDNGDDNYSDTTVDGLKLTLYKAVNWDDKAYMSPGYEYVQDIIRSTLSTWVVATENNVLPDGVWHYDGVKHEFPTWKEAWEGND